MVGGRAGSSAAVKSQECGGRHLTNRMQLQVKPTCKQLNNLLAPWPAHQLRSMQAPQRCATPAAPHGWGGPTPAGMVGTRAGLSDGRGHVHPAA